MQRSFNYLAMNTKLFFFFLLLMLSLNGQKALAQDPQGNPVVMTLDNDGHNSGSNGSPKAPDNPPQVSIYDHVLYFSGSHDAYTLTLTDENENVVYVTNVSASDTQVVLPASLIGVFKLRLYTGIYCFVGEITL